jgi:multiple sugar transport system ATP-binding protein
MMAFAFRKIFTAYSARPLVLREVNLGIGEHEFCIFLAPSVCGKSTSLRLVAGLEDVSPGE